MIAEGSEIIVVSGLPRSGTSLMLQMLEAAGVNVLQDDRRPPDESNPRGYYEYEPVTRLASGCDWMEEAAGKSVKVIHFLLKHLPRDFGYKVLFMRRDLREVVRSQNDMLRREGRQPAGIPEERLIDAFRRQLAQVDRWLASQPNMDVLNVEHRRLIRQGADVAGVVCDFLQRPLNRSAMAGVVDPELYRQRT